LLALTYPDSRRGDPVGPGSSLKQMFEKQDIHYNLEDKYKKLNENRKRFLGSFRFSIELPNKITEIS